MKYMGATECFLSHIYPELEMRAQYVSDENTVHTKKQRNIKTCEGHNITQLGRKASSFDGFHICKLQNLKYYKI